jgi:hypothetical protein
VHEVSFEARPGEMVGLLAGLLKPDRGETGADRLVAGARL